MNIENEEEEEEEKGRKGGREKKGERICRFHTKDKYSSIRRGNKDPYDESYRRGGARSCYIGGVVY